MTQATPKNKIGFVQTPRARELAAGPPPQLRPALVVPREEIATGSVFMKKDTALPVVLRMNPRRLGDWEIVSELDGLGVERELRQFGWHFFFMVPEFKTTSIALDSRTAYAKAIRGITRAVDTNGFNALEISAIKQRNWLGIHFVSIRAHPRHVRNSPFIRNFEPRHY